MYVSYRAYRTEDESRKELEHLIDHKEEYIKAKTSAQHWKEEVLFYSLHQRIQSKMPLNDC